MKSTIYDVRIRYSVDGRGAAGVRNLTSDVRQLGRETSRVSGLFGRMSAAVVGAFGLRAAGHALIGFNSQIEVARVGIAGLLKLNLGGDFSKHTDSATRMIRQFQIMAKQGVGETVDFVEMAKMITRPATVAGASIAQLTKLTQGAVVASKAFGMRSELAALDIEQALMGTLAKKDRFARALIEPLGLDTETFNKLSAQERFETLYQAMTQPAIQEMANAYEQTFDGAASALKDNLTLALGKVGLPLMKTLSAEIRRWNTWIDENQGKVDAFATKLADGLVTGFRVVKDAVSFLVDHADTLLAIGKVWAAVKIGGLISGLGRGGAGSLASGLGAMFGAGGFFRGASDRFNPETGEYEFTGAGRGRRSVGGLRGVVGNLPIIAQSLAAGLALGRVADEALGLSSALSNSKRVNGQLLDMSDKTTRKYAQLVQTLTRFDAAVAASAAHLGRTVKGAGGTHQAAALTEHEQLARRQIAALQDALNLKTFDVGRRESIQRAKLEKTGLFDSFELDDIFKKGLMSSRMALFDRADAFRQRREAATISADRAWEALPADIKASLDQQVVVSNLMAKALEVMPKLRDQEKFVAAVELSQALVQDALRMSGFDPTAKKKVAAKPNVNITIQRIEVQSDDPDRFAFGLVDSFRDAVKNPSAAVRAIREG